MSASDEERAEELLHFLQQSGRRKGESIAAIVKEFENVRQSTIAAFARAHVPFQHDDFDAVLEHHRKRIESGEPGDITAALRFLLALAHQPTPGGVVEVGGSSPEHQYEDSHEDSILRTLARECANTINDQKFAGLTEDFIHGYFMRARKL